MGSSTGDNEGEETEHSRKREQGVQRCPNWKENVWCFRESEQAGILERMLGPSEETS